MAKLPSAAPCVSTDKLPAPPKNPPPSTVRRLMTDLKEVAMNPLPDVVAAPVGDNLFYWHGNIRGPPGTYWAKAVLHIGMSFKPNYPYEPPTVTLFTPIPHTYVYGSNLCVDLLTNRNSNTPNGWTPAYSVYSILLQLQSFLFEKFESADPESETQLREALDKAAGYSCIHCQHRPRLPVPAFPFDDKGLALEKAFINMKTQDELKTEEFTCFFTRETIYKAIIGFGLQAKKNPRTRRVTAVTVYPAPLSLNAFFHFSVRKSAMNEAFSFWMPYVINATHGKRAQHYIERSISQLMKGDPKSFAPELAVDLLPIMATSFIVSMMKGSIHASESALNGFTAVYHIMLLLLEAHPSIQKIADNRLRAFITDKSKRTKEAVPALGDILPLLLFSSLSWADLRDAYIEENTDRDVLWVLKAYEEIAKDTPEDRRAKWFAATAVGKRLLAFQIYFIEKFAQPKQPLAARRAMLDKQWGQPTPVQVAALQAFAKQTQDMSSWEDLWASIGFPALNVAKWDERLLAAMKSSEAKGYHGQRQGAIQPAEHARQVAAEHINVFKTLVAVAPVQGKKGSPAQLKDDEPAWKIHVAARFYISELKGYATWRECFCTEAVLSFIRLFDDYPDFDAFYSLLSYASLYVRSLTIDWWQPAHLKSRYYWLSALVRRLAVLESLTFDNEVNAAAFPLAAAKKLAKGLFFKREKTLTALSFVKVNLSDVGVLLTLCPILESLPLRKLSFSEALGPHTTPVGRLISGASALTELVLREPFQQPTAQLDWLRSLAGAFTFNSFVRKLSLVESNCSWDGLSDLFKELSTHARIEELNLSSLKTTGRVPAQAAALANAQANFIELLSKTKSLKTVNFWKWTLAECLLSPAVWAALARNTTVTTLDIAGNHFGRQLSVDAARNGLCLLFQQNTTLTSLNIDQSSLSADVMCELGYRCKNAKFAIQELSYEGSLNTGENSDALGGLLDCMRGLRTINLDNGKFETLVLLARSKQSGQKRDPKQSKLRLPSAEALGPALARLPNLTRLSVAKCQLQEVGVRPIALSLAQSPSLTYLDISKNKASNAAPLAHLIATSTTLKELDITDNDLGVEGARLLAAALLKNTTLENIHFGVNAFKNKGTLALLDSLKRHPRLHTVDLSANYITDEAAIGVLNTALERKWQSLCLGGNELSDKLILQLEGIVKDAPLVLDVLEHARRINPANMATAVYVRTEAKLIESELRRFFTVKHKCGAIKSVAIYKKRVTRNGRSKFVNIAFVTFVDPKSIDLAVDIAANPQLNVYGNSKILIAKAGVSAEGTS